MERRRRFIEAYVANFGWPTRAARIAGLPERGVRVAGYRLLREPDVRAAIDLEWRAYRERQEREWREELRRTWGRRASVRACSANKDPLTTFFARPHWSRAL